MPSLYLTDPRAVLELEAGRLLVTIDDTVLLSAPLHRVDQVVLVGAANITTPLLLQLLDHRIGLVFLTQWGTFRGRLTGQQPGTMATRRMQYRRQEDEVFCLELGRAIIGGKIHNQRAMILRWDDSNANPATLAAAERLLALGGQLELAASRTELMGLEGYASRLYFPLFARHLNPRWAFPRRTRRPPRDPANCVLSVVYTLLHEACASAIELAGLDPRCGYLHGDRAGRDSLALDLMEEFRAGIADALTLQLFNKRMLNEGDFEMGPNGAVWLAASGWRVVGLHFTRRMRSLVRPEGVARRISYQKVLELQANRMADVIEGKADRYAPLLIR